MRTTVRLQSIPGVHSSNGRFRVRMGPAGVHLFDRRSGLNVLLDEVVVPRRLWSTAPRQVSIALTNACDLACPYCYAPKHGARLNFEVLTVWLQELDQNGCLGVGFGGGEPTLFKWFPEVCRFAATETNLAVTFTTHAHRLSGDLLNQLDGHVHFARVSMDGIGETYESLRGRSFTDLKARLADLRAVIPFGINVVVNDRTLADLDLLADTAQHFGARQLLLLPEQPVGGRAGIAPKTARALRAWIKDYRGAVPLAISVAGADGVLSNDPLGEEKGLSAYAHIDADGTLKRSSFESAGVSIGSKGFMFALEELHDLQEGGLG